MSGLSTSAIPQECANLACRNRLGEGAWDVVTTDQAVVGGHRPLILSMCGPCANALRRLVGGPETRVDR